ncbi:MAG: hypothetical protein PUP91_13960 [Rhizonema sp. PD37]|nr:hypothetical protein [Rhizonema sp. PD37]
MSATTAATLVVLQNTFEDRKLFEEINYAAIAKIGTLKKAEGRGQRAEGTIGWGFRPQPIVSTV